MVDFIEGVDNVHERNIVDYNINKYDYLFIEFLLNSNMYMLNGRNCINNDFTCITSNGRSVVDYFFEAHEDLSLFSDFNIYKVSDAINEVGHDSVLFSSSFPDHSILTWQVDTGQRISYKNTSDSAELNMEEAFIRFETRNIPDSFLSDMNICRQLHKAVFRLENNMSSQNDLDEAYGYLCTLLKDEMKNKLDYKRIKIENSVNNNKRKIRKPWWNTELTEAWNVMCKHENRLLSCKNVYQNSILKSILKQVFVSKWKQSKLQNVHTGTNYNLTYEINVVTSKLSFGKLLGK